MNRNLLWKFLLILFVLGWSLWELYPPTNRDLFGVFLEEAKRRDQNFTSIVEDVKRFQAERPQRGAYANLREAIGTNDIARYFPQFDTKAERDPTAYILNRLQRLAAGKIKLGLDLQGGSSFLVEMQMSKLPEGASKDTALANAAEVLRKRIDKFGVAEPVIQPLPGANQILIQMPGLSEAETANVRTNIQKVAFLEFRMVHEQTDEKLREGIIPPGYTIMKEVRTAPDGSKALVPFLVEKKRVEGLSGRNIKSANVVRGNLNDAQIAFKFDTDGASVFGKITQESIGRQMAIILDGELYSAPVIRSAILDGNGVISGGNMTDQDAFNLAAILQNPLEAPVTLIQENSVDPSLGKDTIRSGINSAVYGTIAVAGFMLIYYMFAGVVANVAMLMNIIILLGVFCSIGATLTLPGIAGIVLTVGMSVDANVLIFERIREESKKGKSLRGALAAGYDRAFSTILDSHVTTLISSVILIYMGTGSIKGFGVTLTIGVAASLFTALVVTRLIFDFLLARNWLKSLPMLHIIRPGNLNFMKFAKPAFLISWALILIGLSYGIFFRGSSMMGVDFAGGDNLTLNFSQKVEVEKLRGSLTRAGIKDPLIQYQRNMSGGPETLRITSHFDSGEKVASVLQNDFPEAKFQRLALEKVGPTLGKEIQKSAIVASLIALFGILVYVAFRYEFSFAVGAVVAILHDIMMTIGWYCLSGREFNATVVAALLTIIGFSINDTVVIFDRIREDLKTGARGSFLELINHALNQTLSRTIITSGTVFLATLALYIFGGGAINDFAFTFLVGILTGTYSSMYIASALVLWWHKGQRPKTGSQVIMDNAVTARV